MKLNSTCTDVTGSIWYDTTTGLAVYASAGSAWQTIDTPNSEHYRWGGGTGDSSDTIIAGGLNRVFTTLPAPSYNYFAEFYQNNSEKYNGISWSQVGNTNVGRSYALVAGDSCNALMYSGGVSACGFNTSFLTEDFSYTPSSYGVWTLGASIPDVRYASGGGGTQNSSFNAGGCRSGWPIAIFVSYTYNGTSWSTATNMGDCRAFMGSAGDVPSGLIFGGEIYPSNLCCGTLEYNGASWSAGGSLITRNTKLGGAGTQNAALAWGGLNFPSSYTLTTQEYNGTTWATGGNLIYCVCLPASSGTQNAAFSVGGNSPALCGRLDSQEYNGTSWSTGGKNFVCLQQGPGGAGTQNSTIITGAGPLNSSSNTAVYNGTTFSSRANMLSPVGKFCMRATGTTSAALNIGGATCNFTGNTEEYTDCAALGVWSTGTPTTLSAACSQGSGTYNNAFFAGGVNPSFTLNTNEWNGSTWSNGGAIPATRRIGRGAGTANAGLIFGGSSPIGQLQCCSPTYEYNGTSWSTGPNMISGRQFLGGGGTQNSALATGGAAATTRTNRCSLMSEGYDGTTWSMERFMLAGYCEHASSASGNQNGLVTQGPHAHAYVPVITRVSTLKCGL